MIEHSFDIESIKSNETVIKLAVIAVMTVLILVVRGVVRKTLNRTITDTDRKYKARKAVTMLTYLLLVAVVLFVYSDKLGNIGLALGVAGAGIAFALQEVIVSLAGWLTMVISGSVSVGQRVRIGDVKGDVIDIGVFNTTIMEIGDWVDGDLYNGCIVSLSNSFVYKEKVHNYSAEYPFLWDEVTVPVRAGSDHAFAKTLFKEVLVDICGDYAKRSRMQWQGLTNKYRVEQASVEPMVTLRFDENWVTFTLRYVVDFKLRRSTKDLIFTRLLNEISKHPDKVSIAASTLEVTQTD